MNAAEPSRASCASPISSAAFVPRTAGKALRAASAAAVFALWLVGCGGGDGAGDPGFGNTTGVCAAGSAAEAAGYAVVAKSGVAVGQSAGATVAGCRGAIVAPQWVQTAGPPVTLQSGKTQTISFDPVSAGRYEFRVSFRDEAGAALSSTVAVDVAAAAAGMAATPQLALRVNHSVRMGGNVSVRAWPTLGPGDGVASITWAQLEGPAVTLDTRDSHAALFVAPPVTRDTLVRLRATLTTTLGRTASDEVLVLVEQHAQAPASDNAAVWGGDHVSRVYAYRPTSPYAGVLARCVYDTTLRHSGSGANLCPLSQLPFLAQQTGGALPTVEQVLDRLLVSHDWMGRNFETFLRTHDTQGDFRRMLMSVTAVVIGAQVRPSFYYAATGAIYLDADNFWLTPEERDTVNEAPDFRSGFGQTLQYTTFWRYVDGSTSLFQFFDPRQRVARGNIALLHEAGWLMYHELAHALDFMPPGAYAGLINTQSAWGNISPRFAAGQLTSDLVPAAYPLTSSVLAGLGQVRFFGATANATQNAYTPLQVANFFAADLATDDYAYATTREDVAMALEEFLMSRRHGFRRDFAVVPRPGPGATGSTILVTWGQRGRIGEPALRTRLRAVMQQLTPWIPLAEADLLPAPLAMRAGESWTANLVLPAPPAPGPGPGPSPRLAKSEPSLQDLWLLQQAQRRHQRLWPGGKPLPGEGGRALQGAPMR